MIVVSFVLGAVVALAVAGFVYALVETFFNIDRAVEKERQRLRRLLAEEPPSEQPPWGSPRRPGRW